MSNMLHHSNDLKKAFLGIELGSTRIKSVLIDENYNTMASGAYTWESTLLDGIWTYSLEDAIKGLIAATKDLTSNLKEDVSLQSAGISGMMHGYLAFDENWELLVPFRTWQNTITRQASELLIGHLNFNIPQRWSIAHLFQAILNREPHVPKVAHITTLAGYMHFLITGENTVCVDEASGMFPICAEGTGFDKNLLSATQKLFNEYGFKKNLEDILPDVKAAGTQAGCITEKGALLLKGLLPEGTPMAPPAGDGGTGMVATNSIAVRTGNVSAGTSIFADIVLEHPLQHLYPEIDIVTTPEGRPVAEIHGNNCTADMNLWVKMLKEALALFGEKVPDDNTLFTTLYEHSLTSGTDCDNIIAINYLAGEAITHLDRGYPMIIRQSDSKLSLAGFFRAHLNTLFATLKIGMDILKDENVKIDWLMGHGGVFKTPVVGQKYLAAACNTSISCMENASEGGPFGMALLCAYMSRKKEGETLVEFLNRGVFADSVIHTIAPAEEDVKGFESYMEQFKKCLELEKKALEAGI